MNHRERLAALPHLSRKRRHHERDDRRAERREARGGGAVGDLVALLRALYGEPAVLQHLRASAVGRQRVRAVISALFGRNEDDTGSCLQPHGVFLLPDFAATRSAMYTMAA